MTTSLFWNTRFQQVWPSTRTLVSSEQTTRARRRRARIALTAASMRGLARRNAASSAPWLLARPNNSSIMRLSRRSLMAWVKRRYSASATILMLNGLPGSRPSGSGAKVVAPHPWQSPG